MPKGRIFNRSFDTLAASISDTLSFKNSLHINYIEIPFNLTHKFPLGKKSRFVLSAGPYLGFFYSGNQTLETRQYSNNRFVQNEEKLEVGKRENQFKTLDAGLNVRAGFELGNVWITGFMSQGLSSFYNAASDTRLRHKAIGASLSVWLNKAAAPVPKDTDKDGISDKDDACATEPGSLLTQGCPDRDGDGIADNNDKCPDQAGVQKYNGCPIPDTDKDGINDEEDKCPQIAGTKKYDGCPVPDSDGDGINDEEDACPQQPGTLKYNGCPVPDRDKDGVNDELDRCPDLAGSVANDGCPEVKKEVVEKAKTVARNLFFEINSARISPASFPALNELADLMKTNQSALLQIEGHTDKTGSDEYNLQLSQRRAEAIKTYLVDRGIEGERLIATGFGAKNPVADNETPAGRNKNRRVELKLK